MDTCTARDYLYTYPHINAVMKRGQKPRFGWQESDIYDAIEVELARLNRELTEIDDAARYYIGKGRLDDAVQQWRELNNRSSRDSQL